MKKIPSLVRLLAFALLFCPLAVRAQDTLRISRVGFGGYYAAPSASPVEVHIPASPAHSVQLVFTIRSGFRDARIGLLRTDRFSEDVPTVPGQAIDTEIALPLPQAERIVIDVAAIGDGSQGMGQTGTELAATARVERDQRLVGVFCESDAQCESVQSRITQSGTASERAAKGQKLKWSFFSQATQLPAHWWGYDPAHFVVVDVPISSLPAAQLGELEKFARAGGVLVLVEPVIADPAFLAGYRQGPSPSLGIALGRGRLLRVHAVESLGETEIFAASDNSDELAPIMAPTSALLNRVGIFYRFPPLRTLLIWLGVYIVIVGPVNFTVLRYLGRLEWGWATVCLLAVFFAAGAYIVGSARRPKNYTLDQVTMFRMDARSPIASEDLSVRLSSPRRGPVSFSVNDPVLPDSATAAESPETDEHIGLALTGRPALQDGWNAALGAHSAFTLSMLRWSFRDFHFFGFREFAGTVHWTSPGHLRNDTGQTFREAIYIDENANRQTLLPGIAPGEEIDVSSLHSEAIWKAMAGGVQVHYPSAALPSEAPFSVAEVPYLGLPFRRARAFVGLADSPMAAASWITPGSDRRAVSLTIVELDAP